MVALGRKDRISKLRIYIVVSLVRTVLALKFSSQYLISQLRFFRMVDNWPELRHLANQAANSKLQLTAGTCAKTW
jgi:hypothetical protein